MKTDTPTPIAREECPRHYEYAELTGKSLVEVVNLAVAVLIIRHPPANNSGIRGVD
jgi:hypothetical protein